MSTIDEKLDMVLKNQGIIMQMLSDLIEAIPAPGKRPDMMAALAPLFDSPIIKGNPMLAEMLNKISVNMGGS